MCWPFDKNEYKSIKIPIIKYKRCHQCDKKFGLDFENYVKTKKNKSYYYYCSTQCYILFFDKSEEFFDIKLN